MASDSDSVALRNPIRFFIGALANDSDSDYVAGENQWSSVNFFFFSS